MVAALDLFSDGGARSVTHRAVAAAAGVPAATVGYYFGSIDELMYRSFEEHFARWIQELGAYVRPDGSEHTLDDLLDFLGLSSDAEIRTSHVRMTRLFLAASDDERLRPLVAESVLAVEGAIEALLRRLRVNRPRDTAQVVATMTGGCALRLSASRGNVSEEDTDRMRRAIYQVVTAAMLPDDVVEATRRSLGL